MFILGSNEVHFGTIYSQVQDSCMEEIGQIVHAGFRLLANW